MHNDMSYIYRALHGGEYKSMSLFRCDSKSSSGVLAQREYGIYNTVMIGGETVATHAAAAACSNQ